MNPITSALLLALTLTLGIGPGLVLQIDASINRGLKSGVFFVTGLYAGDLLIFFLANLSLLTILNKQLYTNVFGIVGGLVLAVFGLHMFFKKVTLLKKTKQRNGLEQTKHLFTFFFKGVLVNLTNPTILFFWITLTGFTASQYGFQSPQFRTFFAVLFGAAFCLDIFKIYLISRSRKFFNTNILQIVNKALGALLFCIGIFFVIRTIGAIYEV